jgi:diguanylate cyclase (GGDEF)-like protein
MFFFIFLLLFIIIATLITNKLIHRNLLVPLSNLNNRVKRLKLTSHEQHIDWQREPQTMREIDQIDESISDHIHTIQGIYDKLDELTVTKHESGIFHKERYNEVIRYELFRSHRYHHPFSILLIKLDEVKVLNSTAKNIDTEDPGSKYMVFGQILHNESRETDWVFRLEEKIFAIVTPETDEAGIAILKDDIYKRLTQSPLPSDLPTTVVLPEYQFSMQLGASTFTEDNKSAQGLMRSAIKQMQEAEPLIGRYPPKTPK